MWWCWRVRGIGPVCGWNRVPGWDRGYRDKLVRQRSKVSACYEVLRDHLWFMGPSRPVHRCSPGSIKFALVVSMVVTEEPHIPGMDV